MSQNTMSQNTMKRIALALVTVMLAACGGSAPEESAPATTPATTAAPASTCTLGTEVRNWTITWHEIEGGTCGPVPTQTTSGTAVGIAPEGGTTAMASDHCSSDAKWITADGYGSWACHYTYSASAVSGLCAFVSVEGAPFHCSSTYTVTAM